MDFNNIERNQLDYILTDVLPAELSGQFSYYYFYEYLNNHNKEITRIIEEAVSKKNQNKMVFKESKSWTSMPLSYTIMKQPHSERVISLLQPLAAIELFVFISAYQKELLALLQKNSMFSLRYHTKNNDLNYKSRNKNIIKYFVDISQETGKEIIEQTGMYFNIGPCASIKNFTSSELWLVLNSKYKYFIRTDYKACFDSIYTHTFNWIVGKDVNDTKEFKNGSIYSAIDQILMNINAHTSNGIVVGPEFSRMVAELLLQTIDREVFDALINKNIEQNENYNIYRYVDDIFIFADSEQLANEIVELYSGAARKYLLRLNESKQINSKIPFVLESWLNETNISVSRAGSLLFNSKEELSNSCNLSCPLEKKRLYLLKSERLNSNIKIIMKQFNELICKYEGKEPVIVAYYLSAFLNTVGQDRDKYYIFEENVQETAVFNYLKLLFFIYSFYPNYNNTQRFLSILSYIKDEFDFLEKQNKLQELFNEFAFIFDKANLNDIVNLILFCCQAKIEIPYRQEIKIFDQLMAKDDPILWASYLLYSQYSKNYYEEILNTIKKLLIERIAAIVQKDSLYTYREFWWVLIFNKSPHITDIEQQAIDKLLNSIQIPSQGPINPGHKIGNLFKDYMINSTEQFFNWDINQKDFLRNMTFKTRQKSIFKNHHDDLSSLDWSSIL